MATNSDGAKDFSPTGSRGCGRTTSMLNHAKKLADSGRKVLVILHCSDFRDDVKFRYPHENITYSTIDNLANLADWHGPCVVDHRAYEVLLSAVVGVAERQGDIVKQVAASLASLQALLDRLGDAADSAVAAVASDSAQTRGRKALASANALFPMVTM